MFKWLRRKAKNNVPKHIHDCFFRLKEILSDEDLEAIKSMEEDKTYMLHFSLGMTLRNDWGLWEGSELSKYFNKFGIDHPDDMTATIFTTFWRYLNDKPLDIEGLATKYQEYWKNMKVQYPKSF